MPKKTASRKTGYQSDVRDEEWGFCAPYLSLMKHEAPQREHSLRAVFNALHGTRRMSLADDPQRSASLACGLRSGPALDCGRVFEAFARDLRKVLRILAGRAAQPSSAIIDGRTVQWTLESGGLAGYYGYKRRRVSKVHAEVDTLGLLEVQAATGDRVKILYADQGYTGKSPKAEAQCWGMELVVVKLAESKRGFVFLPKRWVVERSFAWPARFRRMARDYERLPGTFAGLHWLA